MPRCTERSPINDWQCNRTQKHVDYDKTHQARDPRALPPDAAARIIRGGTGGAAIEEWED